MKKKNMGKVIVLIILTALLVQAGFIAYSISDDDAVIISEDIKSIIKNQDPDNYERNLNNYKSLLVQYDVHDKFRQEIERLLYDNRFIGDILTAYAFLYDEYGMMGDIESIIVQKESGTEWHAVFKEYKISNPEFIPRAFDSGYLKKLMETPGITADDIMIADRVSGKTGAAFESIIEKRKNGPGFKEINAELDVLNSQSIIPHIPVTAEEIKKYSAKGLKEDVIVESLVIAHMLSVPGDEVIQKVIDGFTNEQIIAEYLISRYY